MMSGKKRRLKTAAMLLLLLGACLCASHAQEQAQVPRRKVAIVPLKGMVDWHMLATMNRRLKEAEKWGARHVVFEINSYGGYLDAIEDIAKVITGLSSSGTKTTAFIENKALSGGAYLALACEEIFIEPEATFGDCKPILATLQELPEDTEEKMESPIRARFEGYARRRGYPVALAKSMVSADIEVIKVVLSGPDGEETHYEEGRNIEEWIANKTEVEGYRLMSREIVVSEGELLTMAGELAKEYGFAKDIVGSRDGLLQKLASAYYNEVTGEVRTVAAQEVFELKVLKVNWWEWFVRFLTSPVMKMILLFVGLLGMYVEFKIPGFGLPGIVGIACLSLVFLGSYMVGLASVIEILMIAGGLLLLALEIFVIPGFGVPGISGIVLILLGALLSFQKGVLPHTPFETKILQENILVLVTSLVVTVAAAVLLARYLPRTSQFARIALEGPQAGSVHGDASPQTRLAELTGEAGVAITALRPAGKAKIKGKLVDVVTQGEFMEKDSKIRVLEVDGNRIVVTQAEADVG